METPLTPSRTCAVCGHVIENPDEARCPQCHSRYIRGGTETLTRGGGLNVLPAPKPPPRREEGLLLGVRWQAADGSAILGIVGLIGLVFAGGLAASGATELALVMGVAGFLCLLLGVVAARRVDPLTAAHRQICKHCSYPIAPDHHGRCTECGRLICELPEEQRFCPRCRRALRGFRGDHCPDCGEDVRAVCESAGVNDPG